MGPKQQIRSAVKSAVTAGVPALKSVSGVREFGRNKPTLPDCEIVTPTMTTRRIAAPDVYRHDVQVAVMLYDSVGALGDIEDRLDALADSVVSAITGDATVMALTRGFLEIDYEFEPGDGGGEQPARLSLLLSGFTLTTGA